MSRKRPRRASPVLGSGNNVRATATDSAASAGAASNVDSRDSLPSDVRLHAVAATSPKLGTTVSFVRAPGSASARVERDELLARLNFSAADERRKALLERLRDIDRRRNALAAVAGSDNATDAGCAAVDGIKYSDVTSGSYRMQSGVVRRDVSGRGDSFSSLPKESADHSRPDLRQDETTHSSVIEVPHSPASASTTALAALSPTMSTHGAGSRSVKRKASGPASEAQLEISKPMLPGAQSHIGGTLSSAAVVEERISGDQDGGESCIEVEDKQAVSNRPVRRASRCRARSVMLNGMPGEGEYSTPRFTGVSKCKSLAFCKKLINSMLRDPLYKAFSAPVQDLWEPSAIPRYFDVIAHPMDLRTIKRRLDSIDYLTRLPKPAATSPLSVSSGQDDVALYSRATPYSATAKGFIFDMASFAEDVRLCFRNCMVYCPDHDVLFRHAQSHMEGFDNAMCQAPRPVPIVSEASGRRAKKVRPAIHSSGACRKSSSTAKQTGAQRSRVEHNDDCAQESLSGPSEIAFEDPSHAGLSCASPHMHTDASQARSGRVRPGPAYGKNVRNSPDVQAKYGDEALDTESALCRLGYLRRCRALVAAREKGVNVRDVPMTFDEKTHLTGRISSIPADKVASLVRIVARSSGRAQPSENGVAASEEIELDMDKMGTQTLREIEEFMDSCVPETLKSCGSESRGVTSRKRPEGKEFSSLSQLEEEIVTLEGIIKPDRKGRDGGKSQSTRGGLWDDDSSSNGSSSGSDESGSSEDSGSSDDSEDE